MRRRSKRWTAILIALGLGATVLAAAGEEGLVLLDAPRGAWLGEVRSDAPLVVLEERDGWRRVRLEGWVRASGAPAPFPPGAAAAAPLAPAPPAAVTHAAGASFSGILTPLPGMEAATVGSNLVVWLVGDLERTDAEHAALGEECRKKLAAIDARLAELDAVLRGALNSSDNFREAATRNDRAKADLAAGRRERDQTLLTCRERAESLFSGRALQRTLSDGSGRFEFQGVPPGRYRAVATERNGAVARAWSIEGRVEGSAAVVVEARAGAGPDPYWGLR